MLGGFTDNYKLGQDIRSLNFLLRKTGAITASGGPLQPGSLFCSGTDGDVHCERVSEKLVHSCLLADAKVAEDVVQNIVGIDFPQDRADLVQGCPEFEGCDFVTSIVFRSTDR